MAVIAEHQRAHALRGGTVFFVTAAAAAAAAAAVAAGAAQAQGTERKREEHEREDDNEGVSDARQTSDDGGAPAYVPQLADFALRAVVLPPDVRVEFDEAVVSGV